MDQPARSSFPSRSWIPLWHAHETLLRSFASLAGTTGVTSLLGLGYWTVAARLLSPRAVGLGAAAVSAMTLVGTIGMVGIGTVLIGELPGRRVRAGLVAAGLLTAGTGSAVLGLGFAVVAPHVSGRFASICGTAGLGLLFTAGVALTAVALVFDQASIGLARSGLQLLRNTVFAAAKLAAVLAAGVLLHDRIGIGITLSWVLGIAVSLLATAGWSRLHGAQVLPAPDWAILRGLGRSVLSHYWLNLAFVAQWSLIPVLVTVVVSPTANAAFYSAWTVSSFLYLVPMHLSTALYAEAAARPAGLGRSLRVTLALSYLLGLPAMAAAIGGAHLILSIFGASYAAAATAPLRLLALAYLPMVPLIQYLTVSRVTGRVARAAAVLTGCSVLVVGAAVAGGLLGGLAGVALALLAAFTVQGLVATPLVWRTAQVRERWRAAVTPSG
jgi:O-antigen/teichoic acid export membrane protein